MDIRAHWRLMETGARRAGNKGEPAASGSYDYNAIIKGLAEIFEGGYGWLGLYGPREVDLAARSNLLDREENLRLTIATIRLLVRCHPS